MKKRNQTLWMYVSIVLFLILVFTIYNYIATLKRLQNKLDISQSSNLQIQEKEDPNCPYEKGSLCNTRQKIISHYKDICEKKKLLSDLSSDYIQDLTQCFINGIYCEKIEGFVCHKSSGQQIWYGDTCKKANLEKIGYMEC